MNTSTSRSQIVAVIDDDLAMLAGLKRLLGAFGYAPETFATAEEFLASPPVPDVLCLVVDINLGGMSGIDLCRHVHASGNPVPVIFITARDDETTHRNAAAVGYSAYLRKPFVGQALVDAIKQAVQV